MTRRRCGSVSNASSHPGARGRYNSICRRIVSPADIAATMAAVTAAVTAGVITPAEGAEVAMCQTYVRAIEASDFDRRLKALETAHAAVSDTRLARIAKSKAPRAIWWRPVTARFSEGALRFPPYWVSNRGAGWQPGTGRCVGARRDSRGRARRHPGYTRTARQR